MSPMCRLLERILSQDQNYRYYRLNCHLMKKTTRMKNHSNIDQIGTWCLWTEKCMFHNLLGMNQLFLLNHIRYCYCMR